MTWTNTDVIAIAIICLCIGLLAGLAGFIQLGAAAASSIAGGKQRDS